MRRPVVAWRVILVTVQLAAVLALAGCSSGGPAGTATLRGNVTRIPGQFYEIGAKYLVRMADITPDAPRLVAESVNDLLPGWEALSTTPPIEFELDYPIGEVDESHTYVVWAEIREDGKTVAISKPVAVLTRDAPGSDVELALTNAYDSGIAAPVP